MELESIKVGGGILSQINDIRKPCDKHLTYNILEEFIRETFKEAKNVPREFQMFVGTTVTYGRGCKTLNQVHRARIVAIQNAKFIFELSGIKQRVKFKYEPNDFSKRNRQPRTRRRG